MTYSPSFLIPTALICISTLLKRFMKRCVFNVLKWFCIDENLCPWSVKPSCWECLNIGVNIFSFWQLNASLFRRFQRASSSERDLASSTWSTPPWSPWLWYTGELWVAAGRSWGNNWLKFRIPAHWSQFHCMQYTFSCYAFLILNGFSFIPSKNKVFT